MKFKDLLSEYYSGRTEDIVMKNLRKRGFTCKSNPQEVVDALADMAEKGLHNLTLQDQEELLRIFFANEIKCGRNILDKVFGIRKER
jgi:hypothetical protein